MAKQIIDTYNDDTFWEELENQDKGILSMRDEDLFNDAFKSKLALYDRVHTPKKQDMLPGELITGRIVSISEKEVALDINSKDYVYVDVKGSDAVFFKNHSVGDDVEVMVTKFRHSPYEIRASISQLVRLNTYKELDENFHNNTPFEVYVKERIPAGFMLAIRLNNVEVDAFMPNTLAGSNRLTEQQSEALVGTSTSVLIESIQKERGVYVVSRKKYLKTLIPIKIENLDMVSKDEETGIIAGTLYKGTVTGTTPFGVFVEFDECLTGMIHKMNLRDDVAKNFGDITSGTSIEFYVRDVVKNNKGGQRIILSQNLNVSLWDTIKVGQTLDAKVRNVKPHGVLVELSEDTLGLVTKQNMDKFDQLPKQGDTIKVKVNTLNKDERKIYLDI